MKIYSPEERLQHAVRDEKYASNPILTRQSPLPGLPLATFDEYQSLALRTWLPDRAAGHCLGLVGEAGEVVDLVKKIQYHLHDDPENVKMVSELGDVLWYVAAVTYDATHTKSMSEMMGFETFEQFEKTVFPSERSVDIGDIAMDIATNAVRIANMVRGNIREFRHPAYLAPHTMECLRTMVTDIARLGVMSGGSPLHMIAERNVEKLCRRYPQGFDPARSRKREEG